MKTYQIPGKTFLVGEYLALAGEPVIIALHRPCFEFTVFDQKESPTTNSWGHLFNPESPAGKLIQKYSHVFKQVQYEFKDPYKGFGGFGGSTAEFLGVYLYANQSQADDKQNLLKEYLSLFEINKAAEQKPSGADVVAQSQSGLCYWDRNQNILKKYNWNLSDYTIHFIHTQKKLKTHEHLKKLNIQNLPLQDLKSHVSAFEKSIQEHDHYMVAESINGYRNILNQHKLQAEHTNDLINELNKTQVSFAAKGCGAMGSDVVMVLTENTDYANMKILNFCRENKVIKMSDTNNLF